MTKCLQCRILFSFILTIMSAELIDKMDTEQDYRALVKDVPSIHLGGSSDFKYYRNLLLTGNGNGNSIFPIVSDDDGLAHIAAGTYGEGKFLVLPYMERNLLACPIFNKNTQYRKEAEYLNTASMEECSEKCREKTTCKFWTWHHKAAGKWALGCVLMSSYGNLNTDDNTISGAKNCNPGAESNYCLTEAGRICQFPFIYKGVENSQCTLAGGSKPAKKPWCGTRLDANGEYVGSNWGYCAPGCQGQFGGQTSSNKDTITDDWKKLVINAIEWMSNKDSPSFASFPQDLNADIFPNIKRMNPTKVNKNVDVYIITNYDSLSVSSIEMIDKYLQHGGNIVFGASKTGKMKSLFLKLGFWDTGYSDVEKGFETYVRPSALDFTTAVRLTLENPPPEDVERDTTSQRSKAIVNFMRYIPSKWANNVIIIDSPLCKDVLKPLFYKIVENPDLDDHFPDFASYFQNAILPVVIQKEELLWPVLNTPFPPKVEDSAELIKKKVTINGTYVSKSICTKAKLYENCKSRKWISTGLYAKQGQLINVKVPQEVTGKFNIQLGSHKDDLLSFKNKNIEKWLNDDDLNRPGRIYQWYDQDFITAETKLLSPYGGLIYIDFNSPIELGTFDLEFDNVMESPRFVHGLTTQKDWTSKYSSSKAPFVELEVPGIIFTIPKTTVDKWIPNMEDLANEYDKIMSAFEDMLGYWLPRPMRFVSDVEITHGWGHAGYPIMTYLSGWEKGTYDMSGDKGALNSGHSWGTFHEIGHNIQDKRWTPSKFGETTNNIFAEYINEKLYDTNPRGIPTLRRAEEFKQNGRNWGSLGAWENLNIFLMVKHECSWNTFKKFFKYYADNIPKKLSPNNDENRFSTIAKVLSKMCNKNLIPFFQWWNWPLLTDAIEETKSLPEWEGIVEILEAAVKQEDSSSVARASSVYKNNVKNYGPQLSIDGNVSPLSKLFFHSKKEDFPWLEIKLPQEMEVSSVTIINRKDCCGERLKNAEVRVGMNPVPEGVNNEIGINTLCGFYEGPGTTGQQTNIACEIPISAKYVTIQLKDKDTTLQINELKINEKYYGCARKDNVEYYGDDLGSKKTNGETDCANWCAQKTACEFWTFRKSDNRCFIKKTNYYPISNPKTVSGTRTCAAQDLLDEASNVVSCGGHTARNCSLCPQGHGASWCHGGCTWDDGECVSKPNPGSYEYTEPVNACLNGHNDEITPDVSLNECKEKCSSSTDVECNSLEYLDTPNKWNKKYCYLSDETKDSEPDDFKEPCPGAYATLIYLEKKN